MVVVTGDRWLVDDYRPFCYVSTEYSNYLERGEWVQSLSDENQYCWRSDIAILRSKAESD